MEAFCPQSVLVTGSDRGIGLGLIRRFLEKPNPPKWVFATSMDLGSEEGKVASLHQELANHPAFLLQLPNAQGMIGHIKSLRQGALKDTCMPDQFQRLQSLALGHPNLVVLHLDIRNLESIGAAKKRVEECLKGDGLNLLINNAAILIKFTTLCSETAENMFSLYHTNTVGSLQVSQAFLPLLKKAAQQSPREGLNCSKAAIVNIASDFGSLEELSGWSLNQVVSYRCSKAALNMVTRCQSLEYKPFGIFSMSIHPGWVKTAMGTCLVPTTVKESTMGILIVLSSVTEKDTGSFLDWEGKTVPW